MFSSKIRYWFACIVCPCTLYRDENLVFHVQGQKHQKRAIEKLSMVKNSKKRKIANLEGSNFSSRTSRSDLKWKLENTEIPFLGLKFITEYVNPGNPVNSKVVL